MFSIALCSPPCVQSTLVGALTSHLSQGTHFIRASMSGGWPCVPPWPFRASGPSWFSHLYNGTAFICFFWHHANNSIHCFSDFLVRKGRGRLTCTSNKISSLHIHGNLFVGYHCFRLRNGEQACLSSWLAMKHPSLRENLNSGYLTPLCYKVLHAAIKKSDSFTWFCFLSFCSGTYKNHYLKNPVAL